jgi:NitT/TauT family transport system ATP-binding protein
MASSIVNESAPTAATVTSATRAFIEAKNVFKSFPSHTPDAPPLQVVENFNLSLREGELVTMFGPNGCGKTTILNLLANLLPPDSGIIVRTHNPEPIAVGYVFQNYADTLLPWRTVRGNIAFPLEIRDTEGQERTKRVNKRLEQFHLTEHADKYVYQLSGGLKQLVSIARSTAYDPRLLILDEPFSALDYSLSRMLWLRFREFWTDQKVTTVFVSHNVDEAVFLGDRVCVLSARPARVIADVPVPLGGERPLSLLSSQDFFAVRKQVLDAFEEGRQP